MVKKLFLNYSRSRRQWPSQLLNSICINVWQLPPDANKVKREETEGVAAFE